MSTENEPAPGPVLFLEDEVKSPPFSPEARREVGKLPRLEQDGFPVGLPHSRPMPSIGARCHELRGLTMDDQKRARLKAKGWVEVDVADWLGLDEAERRVIELRVSLVKAIKAHREATGITQAALAHRVGTAQPNIAKIEAGGIGVSLDLLMTVFFATGGKLAAPVGSEEAVV
jgi:DNA-binding XRE family transcriptional regulator